ncbi:MAG: hypothetical protein EPO25_10280 [Gammaproteobacteria bacterium]|nr:MAG: hypothetical protein EPO25_10280 [Gammaproteobacteria bacterium]
MISIVTEAELEEVGRWQSRPLDGLYALMFSDALRVRMRDEGTVRNKAVYLAIGVSADGRKDVYRAPDTHSAAIALDEFAERRWGRKYPAITSACRRNWDQVIPLFVYPPKVRRFMYATNAIESLNSTIRRAVRARGHLPSDEAAIKLIWLQLRQVTKNRKTPATEWHAANAQCALLFSERFEMHQ